MFPWDWILDPGNPVNQVATKIYNFVANAISGVMSWVSAAITTIWATLSMVFAEISNLWNQLVNFAVSIAVTVANAVTTAFSRITSWVSSIIANVWNFALSAYNWTIQQVHRLEQLIYSSVRDALNWIVQNVVQPVIATFEVFKTFVLVWINRLIQYLQHPELLAELIAGALLKLWMQYVARFGTVIARWLLRQMMSTAGEVFDLLERILASIL